MKKFLGMFLGLGLVATLAAGEARADCKICLGAGFEGFGFWSHSDQVNGTALTGLFGRPQPVLAELPAFGNTIVNVGNVGAGGDTDFGLYSGALNINGVAAASDNVDVGFRFTFVGLGGQTPPPGGNGDPGFGSSAFTIVLEQAFVDLHNSDGSMGVVFGRFEPNTGRSLRMVDNNGPFLSVARTQLLPIFLTGAAAYFNSGDVGAAFYLYNDLSGANDQDDLDLGYGLGGFYSADDIRAGVTAFLSPEASDPTASDLDNQLWVFVINGNVVYATDQMNAWVDLTFRRDGHPTDAVQSGEAFSADIGGVMNVGDMLGVGLNGTWTHIMDTNSGGVGNIGQCNISSCDGPAFVADGDIFTVGPVLVIRPMEGASINTGWNWQTVDGQGANELRTNIHTIFVNVAANIDSGAKKRTNGVRSVN